MLRGCGDGELRFPHCVIGTPLRLGSPQSPAGRADECEVWCCFEGVWKCVEETAVIRPRRLVLVGFPTREGLSDLCRGTRPRSGRLGQSLEVPSRTGSVHETTKFSCGLEGLSPMAVLRSELKIEGESPLSRPAGAAGRV